MADKILYDNFSLDSTTVKTRIVSHDQANSISLESLKLARKEGEAILSYTYKPKTITLKGIIKGTSKSDLDTNIDTFKKNVSDVAKNLDISYIDGFRRYKASATDIDVPREYFHVTFVPFEVIFQVLDPPFGLAVSENTAAYQRKIINQGSQMMTATFDGTIDPKPQIYVTFSAVDLINEININNLTTQQQISVSTAFTANDIINIDCDDLLVKRVNAGKYMDFTGVFPRFDLGVNNLQINFSTASSGIQLEQAMRDGEYKVYKPDPYAEDQVAYGESFVAPQTNNIYKVSIYMNDGGVKDVIPYLIMKTDTGGRPSVGTPIGTSHLTLTVDGNWRWVDFVFDTPVPVTIGNTYHLILYDSEAYDIYSACRWGMSSGNPYTNGASYLIYYVLMCGTGDGYVDYPDNDCCFRIYYQGSYVHSTKVEIIYTKRFL